MEIEYSKQQKEAMDAIIAWFQDVYQNPSVSQEEREFYLAGYAGTGKSQPLYEKILTPSGWKIMGDIKIGDSVIGSDGYPIEVVGVFPQSGDRPVYRIHFTDGSSVDACEDHLWKVWDKKGRSRIVDTKYFRDTNLKNSSGYRLRIKNPEPFKWGINESNHYNQLKMWGIDDLEEPHLTAYLYGYILGDGYIDPQRGVSISCHFDDANNLGCALQDSGIYDNDELIEWANPDVKKYYGNVTHFYIEKKYTKFIPPQKSHEKRIFPEYLFDSLFHRKWLLAGLMDSDGTCHVMKSGGCKCRYSTMSKGLKDDVIFLVKSLGGAASWNRSKRDGEYCISIRTPFNPFQLERKAKNWREPKYDPWVGVKSIEYINDMPTQCISVNAKDNLYITKDCILTHNTTIAKKIIDLLMEQFNLVDVVTGSYTGKAVDVLRNKGIRNPRTIHSMIYVPRKDKSTGKTVFELSPHAPASSADLILLDECSMVDKKMAADLRSFRKPMLIMGDTAQLPPIGGTGFTVGRTPDYMLTEIHRQVADSPILKLATMARNGEPIKPGIYGDKVLVTADYTEETLNKYVVKKNTQPICGMNKTRRLLNRTFRKRMGFEQFPYPQAGEKLICCQNDAELGLFNGMMGVAFHPAKDHESNQRKTITYFKSQSEFAPLKDSFLSWKAMYEKNYHETIKEPEFLKGTQKFDFGYALTVHKSQGSEWDTVTVIDESYIFKENANKHLYTAITRAKNRLIIIQT